MENIAEKDELLKISEHYAELPADKRAQFRALVRQNGIDVGQLPIVPLPRETDLFPLSIAQERLWFLWKLDPESAGYVVPRSVRVRGPLARDALRGVLSELVVRHPALRTLFVDVDGDARQRVRDEPVYGWVEKDLSALPKPEREAAASHALQGIAGAPFDLERGPLFRAALLKLGDDDHVFHLSMHHIVTDGWSMSVLVKELLDLYHARATGRGATLPDAAISYADYAGWQREWLDDAALDAQIGYWRALLGDVDAYPPLPFDRAPGAARDGVGGNVATTLDAAVAQRLRELARRAGATLPMVLMAALDVLLYRYTGQADVRVGMPVSGRESPDVAPLVGFFVNTLVIRADVSPAATFGALVAQVRERMLEAQNHQNVPFSRLVDALQPVRRTGETPLFNVTFNHQRGVDVPDAPVAGLRIEPFDAADGVAQFDLGLDIVETRDALHVTFSYARDVFDAATVERLCAHYVGLLDDVSRAPGMTIDALDLLGERERQTLLARGRGPEQDAAPAVVHERIAARAHERGDATALICDGEALDYRALNARANRLAHRLTKLGVGPDVRVGLAVERSVDLAVALLAILKAGGAYVPLDPSYPHERLAYMIADSGVALLLTQSRAAGRLPASPGVHVLAIDEEDVSGEPSADPRVKAQRANLAYVIYTSGSTGRPKGVAMAHDAFARHVQVSTGFFGIGSDDRVLQFSTANFDGFVEQLFPALCVGATVVMRGPALWDSGRFRDEVRRHGITVADLTTAYWQMLVQDFAALPDADLGPLRRVHAGGEAMSASALRKWRGLYAGKIGLRNTYGPTEAAVTVSAFDCDRVPADEPGAMSAVPLGDPLGGRCLYVLDASLRVVPPGVTGELYIGGDLLARGYLNRPGLTAERFVPDPWSATGGRLYRTGDLVRWNANGQLDYLGRVDHQVKVRGFRIEPAEIDAQLLACDGVREAVVIPRDSGEGTRLIAYVTPHHGHTLDTAALRARLATTLPDYMVPSALVVLDALPLNPNGKLDRHALPAPTFGTRACEAPLGATETVLADVWRDVLGVERVGRHDNFFELGGDSILSLKAVARSVRAGIAITPRQLFEHQTVAQLAGAIAPADAEEAAAAPLVRVPGDGALPLSYAQQRLWFLWNLQPDSSAYHVGGGLRLAGALDVDALRASLDAVVLRQASLRTTFDADSDGNVSQRIAAQPDYDYRFVDLSGAADAEADAATLAARVRAKPFDLVAGPLLRVAVIRLNASGHILVMVMHHIVTDGWSVDVLLRELVAHYRARLDGEAAAVAALPVQYADYAVWQRRYLDGGARERQLAYWREQLGGEQPVLLLPADRPRHALADSQAACHQVALDAGLADAIRGMARARGATPFMVLLSAFYVTLHRHTGQHDIRVGVPIANRERVEVEGLIGFFANTQVLRADLHGVADLGALLDQVKTRALDAQAHQDLPFDVLVDALGVERSLTHTPLFQVMFNYQKEDYRVLDELPGLRVSGYDAGPGAAQFELTLNVIEDGDGDITLSFVYAAGLFDAGTIERFGRHYRAVLEAVVRDPATAIGEVGLLDDGERGTLLEWGSACSVDEATLPLHGQIARQAARRPDAVAVVCEGHALSYGELNARANRLAHRLIALGVGPEVRVGLAMERSLELVVGLLAILKAGGAYVPLDPSYPQDRLAYMIGDSGIALLLAQSAVVERLPSSCDVRTLLIDALDVSAEPATDPVVTVHESNLAYVIYTSGSTGRPKGAQLTHRNVARLLTSTQHGFDFNENDVWTLFHSYAFDFSVWEIFGALCHGGRLVVVPYLVSRSPEEFVELLNREQVTVLNQTPSAFRQLMAVPGLYDGRDLSLRLVIFGGEALEPQTLRPWFDHFGDAKPRLVNMYGITETTVHVTYRPITQADLNGQRSPVGERIQDLGVYVLDAQMNLSPVGVEGELYVSGEGLSRGYLNRAGLTAERFVPNPFVQDGSRLYRTGDLARWNAQGELEYAGRLDHQVKVRGFRIELGEIEAQLLKQAGVSEAVVLTQESASGTRLVGYVTARNDAPLDGQSLRSRLAQTLPDYMVPSVVMVLESLPLTPNGKLDRRALPEPENTPSREHDHEAPQGETETTLAQIWQHVLGVPRVGRHDNFFELGGDSILSLQIVARARQSGLKLTARQMFEQQTVAQLATVAQPLDVHQARNEPIEGEAPLLPIQSWFFEHEIPNRHHWNQAVLLTSRDALDVPSLERSLVEVVNHHASLRLRYVQHAPGQWTQTYATDAAASDLLWVRHAAGLDEMQTLCDDAQRSLDLARGPLLRALLLRLPDGSERLLLAAHHLVVDGVSWRILLDDLRTAYGQARAGDAIQLPHSTDSYRQWASRLAAHAQGDTVRAELPYWLSVLDTPSQLPDVRAAGAATLRHERRTGLTLTREATSRLLHDAPAAFRTQVNDLLLTALGRALCRWTGESSIRIDVEGHGREDLFDGIDVSRTVGWFTSLYPVRLEPLGDPGDALLRVKESLRAAPQRGLGYGLLRYAGAGVDRRALSAAPRSSVVFNYLGQFDGSFDEAAAWRPARETPGATRDADSPLEHELSVNGQVYGGELKLTLGYSAERHREAAIDALVRSFRDELEQLIAHCTSGAAGVSPSDFPLAALAQPQLDALRVPAAAIEDLYPLSPMQQGMLFHTLYEPHGGAYLTQLSIGIEGLDVERFRRAWQTVTARHEILRTGFVPCGDRWMQCVVKSVEAPFAAFDWRGRDDQDAALRELAAAEVARGFDLQTAPLHRLVLVRTGGRRHHFVWTHHHMLLDGWSVSQLLGEVLRAYEGKPLPPSGGRYRDYIAWRLSRDVRDDEAWWRAQLARLDAPTRLAGAPDPARGESGQGDCTVTLDAALADALSAFAKRERVTLNTVVQGAWALLLSRCTGQRVVTFGATVAGRPEDVPGAQRMMGLFINTVPVIVGARADRRVGDWLRDLQAQNVEMREHEFTPLHDIQQWAGAGGGLFDSIVVFENYPVDSALKDAAPDGLAFDEASGREQTNYPLTVVVTQAGGLSLQYGFDRRFFDAETVERIAGWTVGVLKALVDRAERAVGEIALGDDGERGLLLGWGSACSVDEAVLPLHEQIARQAARRADAVAVVCEGHALSYGELNARANRLAHRLIALGVGPEVRVGLAMERSLELVVGLLAILKAGGAYVPLDPSYPLDRLAYMIGDSGIALLLAQSSVVERLPSSSEVRTLLIDTLDVSMELATDPLVPVHESNLAYVIYTSGSTGRPKGAQLTHRNVARLLTSTQHWFDFNENDVWTLFHSYAFDFSVWEIFGALCHGGRLVVVPYLVSRSPEEFAELLHRERVTVLNQTPSAFRQLMAVPGLYDGKNLSLRLVIFGGEALEPQTLRPWFDHFGDEKPRLVNMYGITETTVHVTYRPITQADLNGQRSPVGERIQDLGVYVLDAQMNLSPVGVEGELYVSGEGLSRGYLNRAGLTAERFVPNPFAEDGSRLYRTGDLARWNAQGELEYAGRLDHQVKVRGFRIELGEIEAQLLNQPGVSEAVVLTQESASGTRLIGYVTARNDALLDGQSLRSQLAQTLPDYMVPSVVMVLDSLPLTPNGKLDRRALPEPENTRSQGHDHEAPQGETETTLAQIWQHVLGVPRVSRHDNFFELGGHSLSAIQVASKFTERSGVPLALKTLFEHPRLDRLAAALRDSHAQTDHPIRPRAPDVARIPLSDGQERLWFLWKLDTRSAAYNMVGALRFDGVLDVDAMRRALDHLVDRHEVLRTRFDEQDGVPSQVVGDRQYGWAEHDLDPARDDPLRPLLRALSLEPFDLERGPLLRVALIRLSASAHVVHFSMHHIVSDAWSLDILTAGFVRAYTAIVNGAAPADGDPPLPIQYGDYALWQRERLDARRVQHLVAYWRERLGDEHPTLELPAARRRTGLRGAEGGRVERRLSAAQTGALRQLCERQQVTPFIALLAAWHLLLARYSGQRDIRVGVPAAGRDRAETEGLIGFFVNTLVIRATLDGAARFDALLDEVRRHVLEAHEHQDLPFARLVDALQPARSVSHTPLFQTMLNYLRPARAQTPLPGLAVSPLRDDAQTARFDLVLTAIDDDALTVSLTYALDIFDAPDVERMLAHYVEILDQVASRPAMRVGEVVLSVDAGHRTVPVEHPFVPVIERIAAQARLRPDAPALHCEGERLDYRELDAWANRIARRLARLGVGPDQRCGICMRRSAGLVAALLGVMKSGAAFVPLDPDYPADRLAYMMDDAGVSRVIVDDDTTTRMAALLSGRKTVPVASLEAESPEPFAAFVHPDQLAYVIYTSGSTGLPKGVAISQRALSLHMDDFLATYGIDATDKQLQSSTINFDVALHEMLPALMRGGQVEMRGSQPWDLETMSRHLADARVTFSRIPTAYWQQWLREPPGADRLASLRQITVGGEGLPGDALRQWRAGPLAHIRLDNLYGPTETTVACLYRETTHGDAAHPVAPIGRPYPSRSAYVMDGEGNEAPTGGFGELCIGGGTLARGYLNRPAQTAEKFIPDPFANDGARLYRTGDLCRRRPDGTIEFLGRIDQQIKLRGFRIEPGEVEAALRQVDGVTDAVAELKGSGDAKQLVGYVVGPVAAADVRRALEARLPGYMVPGVFVVLDRLPVTQNGKIDRKALPEPDTRGRAAVAAPRTPTEARLVELWKDVLGRSDIGIDDNFFDIGGDSLRALRIVAIARRTGAENLTLGALFGNPTVASLAHWMDSGGPAHAANVVPLNGATAARNLFVVHPAYGLVAEYRTLATGLEQVANVYGIEAPLLTEPHWWAATFRETAIDYADRIRRVQSDGPYRLLGWSTGATMAAEIAAVLEAQGETVDFLGIVDREAPVRGAAAGAAEPARYDDGLRGYQAEDFIADVRQRPERWGGLVPDGPDGDALLAKVAAVVRHRKFVEATSDPQRIAADVAFWWTSPELENEAGAWAAFTDGSVSVSFLPDTNHVRIIHDTRFVESVRNALQR